MQLLKIIEVKDRHYGFYHNNNDDSRYLVEEGRTEPTLIIDANLNIKTQAGYFGSIENESNWILYFGPIRTRFNTGISVDIPYRKMCWEQLEKAEVEVCKFFLNRGVSE